MGGRLKASFLLIVMFSLGTFSGITWESYRAEQQGLHRTYVTRRVKRLKHQLKLDHQQEIALHKIIQNAHDRMKEIHEDISPDLVQIHEESLEAIRALLTPEQQRRLETLHDHVRPSLPSAVSPESAPAGKAEDAPVTTS